MSTTGKVLLADDSPHAQRMGERILREEGYDVVTVTDGETAILRVKDVDPDVVIVDAFLPQVSGYDLCGFIKKQPQHAHVRVLLTSTALERVDEDQAFRAGADGQLKKPFEASVMLKSLKDLISGSDRDSKKKRSGSTFDLSSPATEEEPRTREPEAAEDPSRSAEKGGVSPLQAWLDQHGSDSSVQDKDPDPLGLHDGKPAAKVAVAEEVIAPVGLSNPQLLRRAEDEPEDLSLRNNPVARLRNSPLPAAGDAGPSRVRSISDRASDGEAASGAPSTRSFRMPSKVEEETETVEESTAPESPEPPRQRRSLLDALAQYESDAEPLDAAEDLVIPEPLTESESEEVLASLAQEAEEVAQDEAAVAEAAELVSETAAVDSLVPEAVLEAVDLSLDVDLVSESPEEEPAPVLPTETISLAAAGVRLDEEEIRAAVEIAVSASMNFIVDEVTRCVTMALDARYRAANEAAHDSASEFGKASNFDRASD